MPAHAPSFQDLILRLSDYWSKEGCAILQPYDMCVGAGTFHPATTLRSLGPEPWRAAYVQPSRRPTDGRYGDNPNRLQHYYQFQVIMKPSPPDILDLYLGSLDAIGIDRTCLVALDATNTNAALSARNIANVDTIRIEQLNAFELLNHRYLVVDKASLQAFLDKSAWADSDKDAA